MPRAESNKDIFAAYFLCRLAEVTDKSTLRQLPRLTTAQATLRSKKPQLAEVNDANRDETSLPPVGGDILVSDATKTGAVIKNMSEVAPTDMVSALTDAKQNWKHRDETDADKQKEDINLSSKMLGRLSKLGSGVKGKVRRRLSGSAPLPAIGDQFNARQTSTTSTGEALEWGLTGADLKRATMIMKAARFFKDLDPAILKFLPKQAHFVEIPQDAVVFRQGDPPKNCYIVVSGCVGFYVGGNTKSPRKPCHDGMEDLEVPPLSPQDARVNTHEKWSTYSFESKLGRLVFRGEKGTVFGELALMDDNEARKASAKCLVKSELLAVPSSAFESVKAHIKEMEALKQEFLGNWVPGIKSLPQPGPKDPPHPAIYFHQFTCPNGQVFLNQGVIEQPCIYVVISGDVKVCCKGEPNSEGVAGLVTQDLLQRGAVFGSLPHSAVEPFTVMVHSASCEVYKVTGTDYRYMPPHVIEEIHAMLSAETARRLRRCCVTKRMGWEAQQKLRQSGQLRLKDARATELLKLPARELRTSLMKDCL
eukprot:TRINITY_DN46062_c0_g1_i1.p1 TRINITY_DN46062_c0_g1~~TRINITY_DN46062_c0_g1_i1.p1  ORF type:complete len:534 (-),score=111.83 TRINITY_DN46062_c0_g1_i1:358-1959(-)